MKKGNTATYIYTNKKPKSKLIGTNKDPNNLNNNELKKWIENLTEKEYKKSEFFKEQMKNFELGTGDKPTKEQKETFVRLKGKVFFYLNA